MAGEWAFWGYQKDSAEYEPGDEERSRPIMLGGQAGHGEPTNVFHQELTLSGAGVAKSSPLPVFVTVVSLEYPFLTYRPRLLWCLTDCNRDCVWPPKAKIFTLGTFTENIG